MNHDFNKYSRSGYRAKRRKTNLVLNSLIIIVLLLIIFVAYNIFVSGNDDKAAPKKQEPKQEQKETKNKDKDDKKQAAEKKEDQANKDGNKEDNNDDKQNTDKPEDSDNSQEASTQPQADDSQNVATEGGRSANVLKTIVNPSWKPVGTVQTGDHTPVYSGVDWDEMLNAISYATGLDQGDMTVYWLGSDKSTTNASIGTVYSKSDKSKKYKVYIKWVDGEGWMPTKVEELAELEK